MAEDDKTGEKLTGRVRESTGRSMRGKQATSVSVTDNLLNPSPSPRTPHGRRQVLLVAVG